MAGAVAGMLDFRLGGREKLARAGNRMDADLVAEGHDPIELKGSGIIAAIRNSGVEFILSVPDIVTSGGVLRAIARDPHFRLVRVCKEDECIGIASGLSSQQTRAEPHPAHRLSRFDQRHSRCCGRIRPANLHDDRAPRTRLYTSPSESPRRGANRGPSLDAMGIPHHLINTDEDVAKISPAIELAYVKSQPVALLIGRRPSLS
jgi:hypothetical protein